MLITDRFVAEWKQYHLVYALQGVFLVPVHEMAHCYAAKILDVPIMIAWDSVYYEDPGLIRDLVIILAPIMSAFGLAGWAITAFLNSNYSLSSLIVFTIQLGYTVAHIPPCIGDFQDAYQLLSRNDKSPLR